MPDIDLPELRLPEVHLGERHLPVMHLPDLDLHDRLSSLDPGHLLATIPGALDHLSMPDVGRDLAVPGLGDLRRSRTAETLLGKLGLERKRQRHELLPWVLVSGMVGVFAAWWLWTSSVTGAHVRAAAERVRRRIGLLTGRTSSEDDARVFWADPDGWRSAGENDTEGREPATSTPSSIAAGVHPLAEGGPS
jgi:hypothetical protein